MSSHPPWETVELLAEPTRRALYAACRRAPSPLTREELAHATGISRRLAAFHLDLLADAGLLVVDYARPEGRSGPGAGRPAKRYTPAPIDLELSLPPRRYDVAARVLARGVAASPVEAQKATFAAATAEGERTGRANRPGGRMTVDRTTDAVIDTLSNLGYEPRCDRSGCVRLTNCPFDAAAAEAADVVCGLNLRFVSGMLAGLNGHRAVHAVLDPSPGHCCVTVSHD